MDGKTEITKNYLLVTPCKNEGGNLSSLIDSIVAQTIIPILWVIVDDGSTDNTSIILDDLLCKYEWVKVLRLEVSPRNIGPHLARVMKIGFDYAISFCKKNGLEYTYLGNVDGDLTVPCTFFENLMVKFETNSNLGIASGGTDHIIGGQKIRAILSENEPSGGHMLIRRTCFEECGGIPISYSADSVLKAKARLRKWDTKRFEENIAIEVRDVDSAEGYWKGFIHTGESSHYLNYNPLHVVVRIFKYSLRRPYYGGIAFLVGYLNSILARKKRINDDEVKHYFWNKWKKHFSQDIFK